MLTPPPTLPPHADSRTCPVANRTCQSDRADGRRGGPVHITTGWGGPQSYSNLASPQWPYIAVANNATYTNGFVRMTVSRTALVVEALAVSWGGREGV